MPTSLGGSKLPLMEEHDVALLDLDGVVYVGPDAVPGAADALAIAREHGMRLAFVTNNAARTPDVVADHLTALGIAAKTDEVVTSAQVAARYLADRLPGGAAVLVVGTIGLEEALRERGLKPVGDARGQVDAVVQGYSPELTWRLLAEGAIAINRGVPWVATNADLTVPSPRGPLPGNGSMVAALRLATGSVPEITGKPNPTMHRESVLRSDARRPIVVGDRLDTDVEGANVVGCPSLLVFTGVTTVADLLAAPPPLRPSYVGADLGDLLRRQPAPELVDGGAECGEWRAERAGLDVVLRRRGSSDRLPTGSAERTEERAAGPRQPTASDVDVFDVDALDAVRALCTAAWDLEPGVAPERVQPAESAAETMIDRLGVGG